MRRLLNFCLMLVLLASVGYLLYKAKLLPLGRSSATPAPTAAAAPVRDSLRVSVSHRPEALLVSAVKRLLEAENLKLEVVPFNSETSWMELAAGELDLVIAPVGEAVTAQARFQVGRLMFVSGLSEGYDVILAKGPLQKAPQTVGVAAAQGGELFALQKFPDSRLVPAGSQKELQAWLSEGAIQAAILESASLRGDLAASGKKLASTSGDDPMPTVVVLSRTLLAEDATTTPRIEVLLKALDAWSGLIDYLGSQPELLRSILKPEAEEMGVSLDILLKDYRFLTPNAGRDLLLQSYDQGLLKQTLDLLLLARTPNLTAPKDWNEVLELPPYLAAALPGGGAPPLPTSSPTPLSGSPTPAPLVSPTPSPSASGAPPDPWPEPVKMPPLANPLDFPPALGDGLFGVATEQGLDVLSAAGKKAFSVTDGGPPVAAPLADAERFYLVQAGSVKALDSKGKAVWTYPFEGTAGPRPLLTPSDLVLTLDGPSGYQILAISRERGVASWQATLAETAASGPVYTDLPQPTVLVIDAAAGLTAWSAETGSMLWQSSVGSPTYLEPASQGSALAVVHPEGGVRLLSTADGAQLWEADLGTALNAAPTLTEDFVLLPAKDTFLYELSRKDGSIKGKTSLAAPLSQPAVVVDDHVYCSDEAGGVHSLQLEGLALHWSRSLAQQGLLGPVFSQSHWGLLSPDGALLVYQR